MPQPSRSGRVPPALLRALALLGVPAVPMAWLASLSADPEFLTTNLFRLIGALIGASSMAGFDHRRRAGVSWGRLLTGGVVGSLLVSAFSVAFPALGRATAGGWLMSGVVGGLVVGLALYASKGRLDGK